LEIEIILNFDVLGRFDQIKTKHCFVKLGMGLWA